MSADQTGGGEGGKTTVVPENQMSLARGSAEITVICGRLKDKQDESEAPKRNENTRGSVSSFLGKCFFHYIFSLVWSVWQHFAKGWRTGLICLNFSYLASFKSPFVQVNPLHLTVACGQDRGPWLKQARTRRGTHTDKRVHTSVVTRLSKEIPSHGLSAQMIPIEASAFHH